MSTVKQLLLYIYVHTKLLLHTSYMYTQSYYYTPHICTHKATTTRLIYVHTKLLLHTSYISTHKATTTRLLYMYTQSYYYTPHISTHLIYLHTKLLLHASYIYVHTKLLLHTKAPFRSEHAENTPIVSYLLSKYHYSSIIRVPYPYHCTIIRTKIPLFVPLCHHSYY